MGNVKGTCNVKKNPSFLLIYLLMVARLPPGHPGHLLQLYQVNTTCS